MGLQYEFPKEWQSCSEDLNTDRSIKNIPVSDIYAMDSNGDGSEERAVTFARLLGVRDGSSRDATPAEMTKVAKK